MAMTLEQKIKDLEEVAERLKAYDLDCADIKQEIAWLTDYRNRLRKEIEFRPKELYAIEHCPSGKIIFNARGGCYKHLDEVTTKLAKLREESYRIVTYKLQEGGGTT